jgi:uncharacterized membrane protein YgcG
MLLGACGPSSSIEQVTYYDNGALGMTEVQRTGIAIGKGKRSPSGPRATFVATSPKGKVVDLAFVLDEGAKQRLAARVASHVDGGGGQLMVVTVPINQNGSLELFGWAVRLPQGMTALLVDPKAGAARIEGTMSAEAKAAVVRSMQPALDAGRLEDALGIGIDRLGA